MNNAEHKDCLYCGNVFYREPKNKNNWQIKKFCSNVCASRYNYYNYKKIRRIQEGFRSRNIVTQCKWCERDIVMMNSTHNFCSPNCRTKFHHYNRSLKSFKKLSLKKCLYCGEVFQYKRSDQKTCGSECSQKYQDKLRNSRKNGRPKEFARRYSLTIEDYLLLIKECDVCSFDKCINIHHIVPKSEGGRDSIENYLPLCPNCHKLIHSGYSLDEIREHYCERGIITIDRANGMRPVQGAGPP